MPPKDEVETVIEALRRYTSDNPHACDTPDGIARWWLQGRHAPQLVVLALDSLSARGLLERLPATDGRVRYRRPAPTVASTAALPAARTADLTLPAAAAPRKGLP